ncbi:hypothetical protein [Culicoidibacter larvae]|uniref:Uncharacterized protein n=1 Tax=Culicoidibacter larvae TaxID=2579976 RepID=A0A5R8Q703_9FIRM|nr:hypothetical protein [Culicoidibacter larvae]TLG71176.1 hypothetical protein FEZ08_11520 [Culicoidibacter larvae]
MKYKDNTVFYIPVIQEALFNAEDEVIEKIKLRLLSDTNWTDITKFHIAMQDRPYEIEVYSMYSKADIFSETYESIDTQQLHGESELLQASDFQPFIILEYAAGIFGQPMIVRNLEEYRAIQAEGVDNA